MDISLEGWDVVRGDDTDWVPWGSGDDARAKILGSADGYLVALVDAQPGYRGDPHEHARAEFFYLIEGSLVNQGTTMRAGDGYAAGPGSTHADFSTATGARYIVIFAI
jgi:quercetin dioxygenase-like cupin family protein